MRCAERFNRIDARSKDASSRAASCKALIDRHKSSCAQFLLQLEVHALIYRKRHNILVHATRSDGLRRARHGRGAVELAPA